MKNQERIESLRHKEEKLRKTQLATRKLIQPYLLTLHKLEQDIWLIAKEKHALQAEALLEHKSKAKREEAITKELTRMAKRFNTTPEIIREALAGKGITL